MSYKATVYKILIASPSDVADERRTIPEVIHSWNATNSEELGVVLLPVKWETHSTPEMGDSPQTIIDKQLVEGCDLLIGTFWTRIGTPTEIAESGTVEEIEKFVKAGKPVMLYFSSKPVVPDSIDPKQYERLKSFKEKCQKEGLVDQYAEISELREKLSRHLTKVVRDLKPSDDMTVETGSDEVPQNSLLVIKEKFNSFLRRYEIEWATERESKPYNIDGGKDILRRLALGLLDFMGELNGRVSESVIAAIEDAIKESKTMQKHQMFMDGGKSYGEFWENGTSLIQKLKELKM
ncbi:MAG TPA: hypothetical protein VEG44_06745 [Candidatus Acidoferrales bacterium]|nr:hypothetical protein [Candidatus Acidoferrales bacterium]